jgi:transcriptional regulator
MYNPPHFSEPRIEQQHALIRTYPLGLLITAGADGLAASPLPFHLVTDGAGLGTLQAHLSRANQHWRHLDGQDALVVFQGRDAYITPSWYASKRDHGKVVPTWNYAVVQARGPVRVVHDAPWLRALVERLTDEHEERRDGRWRVSDAPDEFIGSQLKGIVGIEIGIRSIEGKWKVSQNRPPADREGVRDGLDREGNAAMADLVRRYGVAGKQE